MTQSKRITFRVSADRLQALKELAAKRNTNITALIHRALEQTYNLELDERPSGAPSGNQNAKSKTKETNG